MQEVHDFAPMAECQIIIDDYERCHATHSRRKANRFWDYRVLWINSFPDSENETRRILQAWRRCASVLLSARAKCPLYSDTIQVVRWTGE